MTFMKTVKNNNQATEKVANLFYLFLAEYQI